MLLTVISPTADIIGDPAEPDRLSNKDSQLLYGEQFVVEEPHGAYVYGHSVLDGYKGYVEREQLVKNAPAANVMVKVRSTHLYPEPDFKSRPEMTISFLSRLTITEKAENGFIKLDNNHWVFADHVAAIDDFSMPDDLAQTATFYIGTPYLFGGRSIFGIDCSGLVQQVIIAHGYDCPPRDSKDQQDAFGKTTNKDDLQRNDVVFFKGHVGIMMDDQYILNATARHMSTVIENIDDLKKEYGDITHVARP